MTLGRNFGNIRNDVNGFGIEERFIFYSSMKLRYAISFNSLQRCQWPAHLNLDGWVEEFFYTSKTIYVKMEFYAGEDCIQIPMDLTSVLIG